MAVNVAGSLLLGAVVGGDWLSPQWRTVVGIGFLGGFTTFSTFSVQVVLDLERGTGGRALGYVLVSVVLGLAAAAAGYYGARRLAG